MNIPFLTALIVSLLISFSCTHETEIKRAKIPDIESQRDEKPIVKVIRKTPSPFPAFYQFHNKVGNAPQTTFHPSYIPHSKSFRNPKRTKEGSGALLYTLDLDSNEIYVLIAKEKQQKQEWNFMRGSVDIGESYLSAAAREIYEETGGTYKITQNVLLSESYDVYIGRSRNLGCTFFVRVDYVPAHTILSNSKYQSDPHFQEMSDYAWIRLSDLSTALSNNTPRFSAQTIEDSSQTYDFYQYSFNILKQAHAKNILSRL